MDKAYLTKISILFTFWAYNSFAQELSDTLKGPYLGQEPPGKTAKPFALGIVNTEHWGDSGRFSPDMNEFHVNRWKHSKDAAEPESVTFRRVGDHWVKTVLPPKTKAPYQSPDGKKQYFGKQFKQLTNEGWSELQSLGPAFEDIRVMSLSESTKGMLVIDEVGSAKGDGIIRYSKLINGKWSPPVAFGKAINTGTWNAHPFIAPDESYIMWNGRRDNGFGSSDIYISFQLQDGSWGEAINLGDKVNTEAEEGGPRVTPDGKFLMFNRMVPKKDNPQASQSDLYWIDASFIESLRNKQ
ncbi:hypothetical protein [Alteromonas sp. CYL-A6]|uniref:hypothetical protein n=1 Tax=Alteromonas nitratireducens TaxID=3390813 RepID=UPI0034C0A2EE